MKRRAIFYSLIITFSSCTQPIDQNKVSLASSETEINLLLTEKITTADSILLTSHTTTMHPSPGEETYPEILIDEKKNRPNYSIVKELKVLKGKTLDTLINILTMPSNDDSAIYTTCFDPHHTIFILKGTNCSFIDLCFTCWGSSESKDLNNLSRFETKKWEKIYSFFKTQGFKYEMYR